MAIKRCKESLENFFLFIFFFFENFVNYKTGMCEELLPYLLMVAEIFPREWLILRNQIRIKIQASFHNECPYFLWTKPVNKIFTLKVFFFCFNQAPTIVTAVGI